MKDFEIKSFLERFADDAYTEEEHQAFIEYLKTAPTTEVEAIADKYLSITEKKQKEKQIPPQLVGEIEKALDQWDLGNEPKQARLFSIRRFRRIVAAAAVIGLVVLSGAYFLLMGHPETMKAQSKKTQTNATPIVPGGDKAVLTLADGTQIVLDNLANGTLTKQGGTKVLKVGGQLAYTPESSTTEVLYNTVTTPKGGQYQLILADGTKVWLNAASSLRFPATFTGRERRVELTGEGYFEVASLKASYGQEKIPFIVSVQGYSERESMEIQVLGTHFNINSYSEEPSVKTTLLEGKVKVTRKHPEGDEFILLYPGQQAEILANQSVHGIQINHEVGVEEVVAWKNGRFSFNSADVETIMRQTARWYDVDVIFEGKINETFSGGLPRSENISRLLKILKATGKLDIEINGRQLIVKPKK